MNPKDSDICNRCGNLILRPNVAYGISPDAVCKCPPIDVSEYRSISDIKKAVGEMFPLDEVQVSFPEHFRHEARNQLRQEILTALGIEDGK